MTARCLDEEGHSLEQVQVLLTGMLKSLTDNPNVPEDQVKCATKHVSELVRGVRSCWADAAQTALAREVAAKGGPTRRMTGKQALPEAPAPSAVMIRHRGKQAAKHLVVDPFKGTRAVRSRSRGARSDAMSE